MIKSIREDYLKGKIKRQMAKLMNHVEKAYKNLPSLVLENNDVLASYEQIEKPTKDRSRDVAKMYSADELKMK